MALDREEVGPGFHLPVPLEQCPPLAFGHAAPDTELHLVVERVGEALGDDGTVPANSGRFPLRLSAYEQVVGIGGATPRLRHPRDAGLRRTDEHRHLDNVLSAVGEPTSVVNYSKSVAEA